MIIGLILCGAIAVLLFFGIAERVFKSFGIAYWLAFVMVGVLIGSAFIPSFDIGPVTVSIAGFVSPLLFAAVFYFLAFRSREAMRAAVTTSVITALFIALWLLIAPVTTRTVTVIIIGFCCGAAAYIVGKTKLCSLCALFLGMPVGEVIASAVGMYVYGSAIRLGSPATFDAVILAAVVAVALAEAISAIKRTLNANARKAMTESAQEFDENEYKKYFDE